MKPDFPMNEIKFAINFIEKLDTDLIYCVENRKTETKTNSYFT